ncbi:MAG: LysM peptidoglycan-binding domain-containing protein, partial [Dehalococcoidia bacterium]
MGRRLSDAGRGLLALGGLIAVLVGPPVALVRFVGNPLPATVPTWNGITEALGRTGVPDDTVIKLVAVLAWLVWAQLAVALCSEFLAVLRGRPAIRVPVLPGVQPMAARWMAAVMLLVAPAAGLRTATASPLPLAPDTGMAWAAPAAASSDEPLPDDLVQAVPAGPSVPSTRDYVVQRHDSFWSIAEQTLGDGLRWREIRDLNVGLPQPDGGAVLDSSDLVH